MFIIEKYTPNINCWIGIHVDVYASVTRKSRMTYCQSVTYDHSDLSIIVSINVGVVKGIRTTEMMKMYLLQNITFFTKNYMYFLLYQIISSKHFNISPVYTVNLCYD